MLKPVVRLSDIHLVPDALQQQLPALGGFSDMLLLHLLLQVIQNGGCRTDADIPHDQDLLDLIVKIVIDRCVSRQGILHTAAEIVP